MQDEIPNKRSDVLMDLLELRVFSGYIPKCGIAGSYGMSIFSFLRKLHSIFFFFTMSTQIYIPTTSFGGFSLVQTHPSMCYLQFLMMAILIGMRWYLILVFTCMSLKIRDVEHLFMYLMAICMSSFETKSIQVFYLFFDRVVLLLLLLICIRQLYILDNKPLLVPHFSNIFSHCVDCLSGLFTFSFAIQNLVSLIKVSFVYFFFYFY